MGEVENPALRVDFDRRRWLGSDPESTSDAGLPGCRERAMGRVWVGGADLPARDMGKFLVIGG